MLRSIQESADLINQLILQSSTSAIGKTSGSGSFGQLISVEFEEIGSKQAICVGTITPGLVQGWLTDRGWIVQSCNQANLVNSVRTLRRGRERDTGLLSFAFIYELDNKLFLGGLFPRKSIDLDVTKQEAMVAGSIHHQNQRYLAIAKMGDFKLLVLEKGQTPFVFEDSRVSTLSPKGGGVWTGFRRIAGNLISSQRTTTTVYRSVVEKSKNIDPLDQDVRFLEVNGVGSYYIRGGDPALGEGVNISGIWYSKAIRIELLNPPELGLGNYFVYEKAFYYDYFTKEVQRIEYQGSQTNQIEYYLFSGNAISVGSGTEQFNQNITNESSSNLDRIIVDTKTTMGSGLIYLLPGVQMPWSSTETIVLTEDAQVGRSSDETSSFEGYSLPYLINNAADRAISLWTKRYRRIQTFPGGGSTAVSQEQIELRQINKAEPSSPIILNSKPVFALQRIGNTPLLPIVGQMTIAVNGSFSASFAADLPGMAIVYAIRQGNKILRGIGTINSLLVTGGVVQGMAISITSVVRDGYDRLATEQGTIYSNNGSFLSLFNSNPSTVLENLSVNLVGFTQTVWVKDVIHLVDINPAKRSDFASSSKHYAEVWKIDYQVQPVQIFRQPRSIESGKAKLGLPADNPKILKIAGSYFQ